MKKLLALLLIVITIWASEDDKKAVSIRPYNGKIHCPHAFIETVKPLVESAKRRLVTEINIEQNCHIRDLALLGQITTLKKLSMGLIYSKEDIEYPSLDFLIPLQNLEELDVSNNTYMYYIAPLVQLPNLKKLNIFGCLGIMDHDALQNFPALTYLIVSERDRDLIPTLQSRVTIEWRRYF